MNSTASERSTWPAIPQIPDGDLSVSSAGITPSSPTEGLVSRATTAVFGLTTCFVIGLGLALRDQGYIIPDEGLGYYLGIVGGCAMLLLLAYPLAKRTRIFGPHVFIPVWFRIHMVLGVIGPILILYHANFSLGAVNSNVALFSMLIVAGSGLVGRYVYSRVHYGLYGTKADLTELLASATRLVGVVEGDVGGAHGALASSLSSFAEIVLVRRRSVWSSFGLALTLPFRIRFARQRMIALGRKAIKQNAIAKQWDRKQQRKQMLIARRHVDEFLESVSKAGQLAFWERAFALWHVLHAPLFFLLLASGVTHVVAVHAY